MAKFSISDLMNNKSKEQLNKEAYRHIKVKPQDMIPSEDNFYSMDSIEELAKSILLVGLQQPIVLAKVEGNYKVISGHRRRMAILWLIGQGYSHFEEVESLYTEMSQNMLNLSLIIGNAFTRKMTDYDLLVQEQRLKEALIKAKEAGEIEIKGKLRDCIAELLGMSSTKVAQIEAINNNLAEEVKEEVMKGQVSFSSAYEMSKIEPEQQKEVLEKAKEIEATGKDIKQMVMERREQQKKEEMDKEAELTLRRTVGEERLGQVIKVSESNTIKAPIQIVEFKVPDVLQQLLEMYHLIQEDEFIKILEIYQACNERMNEDG